MTELKICILAFLTGVAGQLACMLAIRFKREFQKRREEQRIREGHLKLRMGEGGEILRSPIV